MDSFPFIVMFFAIKLDGEWWKRGGKKFDGSKVGRGCREEIHGLHAIRASKHDRVSISLIICSITYQAY